MVDTAHIFLNLKQIIFFHERFIVFSVQIFHLLGRLFLNILFFLINWIFLISFLHSLLLYRNETDSYMSILYPITLPNSFIICNF